MGKKTILYRGSLKSCNYRCSYCPFSKHKSSPAELEKDRQAFVRFCDSIEERAEEFSIGAVFVTPYGEASIHSWYWEGLARLAELPGIDRVGMQTNLSFSVEKCLGIFDSCETGDFAFGKLVSEGEGIDEICLEKNEMKKNFSGKGTEEECQGENKAKGDYFEKSRAGEGLERSASKKGKLGIWATFHPEMTDMDEFVSKCHKLTAGHVKVCAGAVGVPENILLLKELREKLSPEIYLWINKMDGLRRNYTEEERKAFAEIDPFFAQELGVHMADAQMCKDRCFVEADGRIHSCNISRTKEINWYDDAQEKIFEPLCGTKRCSCYLAYGGRADFELKNVFGEYPLFRIPKSFQAVFFDLDGTLLRKTEDGHRERELSEKTCRMLDSFKGRCPVFLATSMPMEEARMRLKDKMDLFQGGVFASGAYLYLKKENEILEKVYPINDANLPRIPEITELVESSKARLKIYRKKDVIYKITLIKKHNSVWKPVEYGSMADFLENSACRVFIEDNCLEIVDKNRNKGVGVEEICKWLGISPKEALAVGNDREDVAMEEVCGAYIKK